MDIHESVHRILSQQETFADLFYLLFLESYPDVRKQFEGVNMKHQGVLLSMALLVMERHSSGTYPATQMYLRYLGTKHHDRGIAQGWYPNFHDALLATLERFLGADWNAQLASQWHVAIDRTVQTMLEGYREHYHV